MSERSGPQRSVAGVDGIALRRSHGQAERERDLALLRWVGRFRFVTSECASVAFGVSVARMRARVARLCDGGLLIARRSHVAEPRVLYLSRRGSTVAGLPVRRAPRPDAHRRHEVAIVGLVTALETRYERVLTERECRRAESAESQRFSVDVYAGGGRQRRWPDVVVLDGSRRLAFEIEFAAKHTARLAGIVDGYLRGSFNDVEFMLESPALAARLTEIIGRRSAAVAVSRFVPRPTLRVEPWLDTRSDEAAAIRAAVTLAAERRHTPEQLATSPGNSQRFCPV